MGTYKIGIATITQDGKTLHYIELPNINTLLNVKEAETYMHHLKNTIEDLKLLNEIYKK